MKKIKTCHFDSKYMREKLERPKQRVQSEWENGRLVFNTMEDAMEYFREDNNLKVKDLVFLDKFDRWFSECNIKIKE